MNFWTGLILGVIIGWLVEWVIDWLFWRREADDDYRSGTAEVDTDLAEREAEWESRLAAAEEEYQASLRAVEADWQSRLNLNEQQWQAQFATLEEDNEALREGAADRLAGATLGAAGVVVADQSPAEDDAERESLGYRDTSGDEGWTVEEPDAAGGVVAYEAVADESVSTEQYSDWGAPATDASWTAGEMPAETVTADDNRLGDAFSFDADASISTLPATPAHDDLTRIHGIGRKYADLLTAAGITSYDELAAATPDQLRDIVRPSAMQQINFASWSAQATALGATRAARAGDDLTELEGIGPVYASKLRERGIVTFADLAATDEATLAEIIAAPTWRRINYGDWIAQARLAAAGNAAGLREMQVNLFRRGDDNLGLIQGLGGRSVAALQAAGITSFAALAGTTPDQLDGILRDAGMRGGANYNAWIGEAGLRAAGKRVPSGRSRPTHVVPCPQDLSAVAGVGPVFEERLYAAGIGTYWSLAELPAADLAAVLDARDFQGVDLEGIKAAAMRLAVESNSLGRAWDGSPPDDFDGLPGIGEVYERRLYEAGICTYDALAAATPERLAEICQAPAMRTPDYAAWIATAADLVGARSG